jgi:DNA-nicking Smr family endonuclease
VDFGDILDQWEKGQWEKKKAGKAQGVPESPPEEPAAHPLSSWLAVHGVYDKDAEDPELNGSRLSAGEHRRRLAARRPDASIDLHGLTHNEAWDALEQFFESGRRQGFAKLSIIHGKGNHSPGGAVLKRTVREFIERCPFAGASGHGPQGGAGVTWVLLK